MKIRSANDGSVPVPTGDLLCAGDNSDAATLVNQFTALVDEEPAADRLARYRGDVHRLATQIVNASEPETAGRIGTTLADHFRMHRLDERRN